MNDLDMFGDWPQEQYEEFEYQLLYLKPTAYADERIVVGTVAVAGDRLETRFVSTQSSIELMVKLVGEQGVEQFQFAAAEFRRVAAKSNSLASLKMPTDLLIAGETLTAYTKDRQGLMGNILTTSSMLLRPDARGAVTESLHEESSTAPFTIDIFNHVSQLNPLVAKDIFRFGRKITVETGEQVELPILGRKIFGAPVYFAGRRGQQQMKAESYIAKFHWLRSLLRQEPRIYVFKPQGTTDAPPVGTDPILREMCAIAEACDVPLKIAESKGEMAAQILQDEVCAAIG